MNIKTFLPTVQENVPLSQYSSFRIGGPARYFFIAKTEEDIIKALKAAQEMGLSFFLLAGGSNVLFSDKRFNGLVIKIQLGQGKAEVKGLDILVQAGESLAKIVKLSLESGLTGMEWANGIYGTIGGAVRGNAGAFGYSMEDIIKEVRILELPKLEIKNFSVENCEFSYRDSVFKHNKNLVILSVKISLKRGNILEIKKRAEEYIRYRQERQPLEYPSAGSIFKNIPLELINKKLFDEYPELNKFSKKGIIPAGFLIEQVGLKGQEVGQAQISEKHCNFIINLGQAKSQDVKDLIFLSKKKIFDRFGIKLEEEIVVL